jgi:hypothetical protein
MNAEPENVIDEPSMSIARVCELEDFSRATFFKLRRRGLAPPTYCVPGTNLVRVSARAYRKWRKDMEQLAQGEAAQLEQARGVDHARRAGEVAAKSSKHISKRRAAARAKRGAS